jgi:PAP2 superfamily/WD40-like Beta Propeller Repeat/RTX calcium-binding nonapeptide repeat (4 copies)
MFAPWAVDARRPSFVGMHARTRFVAFELIRWLAIYSLYLLTRQVAIADEQAAVRHTGELVDAERALGLFREGSVQSAVSASHHATGLLSAYYMVGFAPVVVGALLWLAVRHGDAYVALRGRLFAVLALAAPLFVLFPAAPPRLVEELGIADTVGLSGHDSGSFLGIRFNPYAAMPSLHVGWSLLVALAVIPLIRRRSLCIVAAAHPLLMALAVTATGNHLFLDIVVGVAIALLACGLARIQPTYPWRKAMSRRIVLRTAATAALIVVAALAATAGAKGATVGANGKIAYNRWVYGVRFDVYSVNPDGTGKRFNLLGDGTTSIDHPAYSPDGREIAVAVHQPVRGGYRGWLMIENDNPNRNGYEEIVVVRQRWGTPWDPTWSPDGSRLAFVSDRDGDWEIYAVARTGGEKVALTHNRAPDINPAWSPDGRRIAFAGRRNGVWDIYVMNADGSGIRRLTRTKAFDGSPSWSPDGSRIAFFSLPATRDAELAWVDVESRAVTRLTDNTRHDFDPAWSPDGKKLVFERRVNGRWDIYTKRAAPGNRATNLTRDGSIDWYPDWQPSCHLRASPGTSLTGSGSPELLCGSEVGDSISGTGGNDSLFGYDSDDALDGGDGNDILVGGAGIDTLTGGPGDDLLNVLDGMPGDTIDAGGDPRDLCLADPGDLVIGCSVQPLLAGRVAAGDTTSVGRTLLRFVR